MRARAGEHVHNWFVIKKSVARFTNLRSIAGLLDAVAVFIIKTHVVFFWVYACICVCVCVCVFGFGKIEWGEKKENRKFFARITGDLVSASFFD